MEKKELAKKSNVFNSNMPGNTAVLKCNIPSFVADFVRVDAWLGSDGTEYTSTTDFGTETTTFDHTFFSVVSLKFFVVFRRKKHVYLIAQNGIFPFFYYQKKKNNQ